MPAGTCTRQRLFQCPQEPVSVSICFNVRRYRMIKKYPLAKRSSRAYLNKYNAGRAGRGETCNHSCGITRLWILCCLTRRGNYAIVYTSAGAAWPVRIVIPLCRLTGNRAEIPGSAATVTARYLPAFWHMDFLVTREGAGCMNNALFCHA